MKRTVFALGGLAVLVLIGYFGWNALRPTPALEPGTVAMVEAPDTAVPADTQSPATEGATAVPEATTTSEPASTPAAITPDTSELPLLPGLSGSGSAGSGMGGGGGLPGAGPAPQTTDSAAASDLGIWNPLADAEYILNATLPADPAVAPVFEQDGHIFTVDDVARFASLFGLPGPVYTLPMLQVWSLNRQRPTLLSMGSVHCLFTIII
ncbi:MAG: hypothetical protein P8183_11140 [Anaerolineae bacterium]